MTSTDTPPDARSAAIPPVPRGSAACRIPFGQEAVPPIASALRADVAPAPFGARSGSVWRMIVPITGAPVVAGDVPSVETARPTTGAADAPATTLTIWPDRGRLDVANPMASVTFTGLVVVDLLPGIEAIFRSPDGSVTVARNGRIMVRSGRPSG